MRVHIEEEDDWRILETRTVQFSMDRDEQIRTTSILEHVYVQGETEDEDANADDNIALANRTTHDISMPSDSLHSKNNVDNTKDTKYFK
jgi:hypothetical protein